MLHVNQNRIPRNFRERKDKRWPVTRFVEILFKFRGIITCRQTIHRWIRVGVYTPSGDIRKLECFEIGERRFVSLALFDRFMKRDGSLRDSSTSHNREGFVYAITDGHGAVKIGFTSVDPRARLNALNTGHPYRLRLIDSVRGTLGTEKEIHRRLKNLWIRGEWFREDPLIAVAFEAFRAD